MAADLKARLASGDHIDGLVVKTPSHQVIEVLAAGGAELVMIDTEHGQIGVESLDAMLAVASSVGIDALVRVSSADRVAIQRSLDAGATGVVVPHVSSAAMAKDVARWCHYGPDGRGFAASTRSAGWGRRSMAEVLDVAASRTVVVVQIEDPDAVSEVEAIASTDGVDAVFVGAADLTVAMGYTSLSEPAVVDACDRVVAATRATGKAAVAYATNAAGVTRWRDAGVAVVLIGSDQSRLLG